MSLVVDWGTYDIWYFHSLTVSDLIRVHGSDHVYTTVKLPMDCSVHQVISHVRRKLSLGSDLILCEVRSTGGRSRFNYFFFLRLLRQGSPQQIFNLHLVLSSASSSVTSTTAMSSLTTSINLLSGLLLFIFHGSSILRILFPIYPSYFPRVLPLVFLVSRCPP